MEHFATAIVGALIAGASTVATQAVSDAYTAAKELLAELVPRFDDGKVKPETEEVAAEELATRLQGLTDEELTELAERFQTLAKEVGAELEPFDKRIIVRRIKSGENAEIDLSGQGQVFEDIDAGRNLKIKTRQINEP